MARIAKGSVVGISGSFYFCNCNLHAEGRLGCVASINGGLLRLLTQVQLAVDRDKPSLAHLCSGDQRAVSVVNRDPERSYSHGECRSQEGH